MRIVVHDYAGHAFPISLSRALAALGHEVVHAFASSLQTPRGDLARKAGDSPTLEFREIPMDPQYARYKYSFRRRRNMEVR
ncbi:MAG: glycosyltransferase WbuB, partial [Verrucomicrobiaceae bacterium]